MTSYTHFCVEREYPRVETVSYRCIKYSMANGGGRKPSHAANARVHVALFTQRVYFRILSIKYRADIRPLLSRKPRGYPSLGRSDVLRKQLDISLARNIRPAILKSILMVTRLAQREL